MIVSVLFCPAANVVGENALVTERDCTVRLAEAGAWLVAPPVVDMAPIGIVFVYVAAGAFIRARTFTVMVQLESALISPPVNCIVLFTVEETEEIATDPRPHVVAADPVTYSRLSPAGRVSVSETPAYGMLAILLMVIVSRLTAPAAIVVVPKDLLMLNACTFKLSVAGLALVTPSRVRIGPVPLGLAGIVFVYAPCVDEVTSTTMMQSELLAMVALLRVNVVSPGITGLPPGPFNRVAEAPQPVRIGVGAC